MKNNEPSIELLFERAEDYSKTTLELLQLKAIAKSADLLSTLVAQLAIILTVALAILIINIGISLWIGELLNNLYLGFFIVGGSYIVLVGLFHYFRANWIKKTFYQTIISALFKQKTK